MIDSRFFKIAEQVAQLRDDERTFLVGVCSVRDDGVIVSSSNSPVMIGATPDNIRKSFPAAHAEIKCARKIDKYSTVFVVRIMKGNKQWALARPCHNCMGVLLAKSVVKIYYSIDPITYGIINVKNKRIISENIRTF